MSKPIDLGQKINLKLDGMNDVISNRLAGEIERLLWRSLRERIRTKLHMALAYNLDHTLFMVLEKEIINVNAD